MRSESSAESHIHQPAGFAVVVFQRHAQRHGGGHKEQLHSVATKAKDGFYRRITVFQPVARVHRDEHHQDGDATQRIDPWIAIMWGCGKSIMMGDSDIASA